ncbi:transketolase family protein [Intestinibacillus sp. Marseille-P6563]|uniref:transketolase family protein n=1 Tax=Intestinibacillus sp. Marseille-P6563 TaxID=2364792 RepID=UPI000F05C623|nr:transketolase C-terminal domain-containing protein [Intestinibacillus sp. Marseille-P6563]
MVMLEKERHEEAQEMRAVFAEVMEELSQQDDRVVYLDADIINSIGMTKYWKAHPERTVNCGIQEANMIGMAAGMSATGLIPFTHTFGCFATRRVMDQVFLSAAYAKLNVRIIGSDPGVTAALNGGTHMPFEDMGLMRCIPEVTILEPTDSVMLADLLRQTKDLHGVFYIRLSRKKVQKIFADGSTFTIGKAAKLRDGNDVTIFATGISVADALRASDMLAAEHISAGVTNLFTIKPIDREAIAEAAQSTGAIVTAENHNVIGGLGSAVAEVLAETTPCALERVGVHDRFGEVGDVEYLKKTLHLTAEDIVLAAKRAIARKGK